MWYKIKYDGNNAGLVIDMLRDQMSYKGIRRVPHGNPANNIKGFSLVFMNRKTKDILVVRPGDTVTCGDNEDGEYVATAGVE